MHATEEHVEQEDYHLLADQVIFQIRYLVDQAQDIEERIITVLEKFLNPPEGEPPANYWRNRLEPLPSKIINFSSPTQSMDSLERFAFVPLRIKDHPEDDLTPEDVLIVLNDAYIELGEQLIKLEGEKYTYTPLILDSSDPGIQLKSISPNFLVGSMYHPRPTGGPGSLPVSKPAPSLPQRKFKLKGHGTMDSLLPFRQPGAPVVILDTAQALDDFPAEIKDIFVADPAMEVFLYPDQPELNGLARYGQPPDHYDMNDHGTFIASIIRTITPSTKIYLYQVLNRFGEGSLTAISYGLVAAINQRGEEATPLIFNCSFGVEDILPHRPQLPALSEPSTQVLIFTCINDAFGWATTHLNVKVVASAGNDAKEGEAENGTQPDPRSPAKLDHILSVAALPKGPVRDPARGNRYRPASYSNRAHALGSAKDMTYSFATLGGERRKNRPYRSIGGPLGVYIGVIPKVKRDGTFLQDDPPNPTGWARWSGTSFAAPVITALLAAQDNELEEHRPLLRNPHLNFNDEQVIPIRQG
ncbi:MAG TPA: S8/S53 family peptidase [Anaerolineales bacterium]|nr:S8/S53 family peptidase [Anaerolineales bacterium]